MLSDNNLHNSNGTIKLKSSSIKLNLIEPKIKLSEILFITSFPARECGIATYSQDLVNALYIQYEDSFQLSICALESDSEQPDYKKQPKYILNTDNSDSFLNTANQINRDQNIEIVLIQHEFGFFAKKESDFRHFFLAITKPIIFVFHTVLPSPDMVLKNKVQEMSTKASAIIVMTKNAANILRHEYGVSKDKINVIQHGTHLVPSLVKEDLKKQFNFLNKKILSTFGLLSAGKGIEVTLDAMPSIIAAHPDVLFLILGKTHPTVVKNEGERYREMLEEKVEILGLQQHVLFVNEYLPLHSLLAYLQLTDIYLFTSKDPNQAVSGTFSYAVSCGCPIISTPIPHAIEVLSDGGIIIDFDNSKQLSNEVITLLGNEELRNNKGLDGLHKMAPTAWQNSAILHAKLFKTLSPKLQKLKYKIPEINLNHIIKMSTDLGFVQFSKIAQPDKGSGYTLDDNARALIAICQHYEITKSTQDLALINTYLQFIKFCLQPDGRFLNYVNEQKGFTIQNEKENLQDSNGRAIWAMGYLISMKNILPVEFCVEAENIIEKALPHLDKIHSTRAMAFIIKGLHYQNEPNNLYLLKIFADRLVQMYRHEKKEDWFWFENYLTYGNSLLPEALLCSYLTTNDKEYKNIAKESFDFLLSKIFTETRIKVISNKGWLVNNKTTENQIGGEQPIDVSYTIMALEKFYFYYNSEEYKQKAEIAFNWFLGKNHLHQIIYNPCTGGCYDGLEEFNVNLNQGAESTISYLMARLSIKRILSIGELMQ